MRHVFAPDEVYSRQQIKSHFLEIVHEVSKRFDSSPYERVGGYLLIFATFGYPHVFPHSYNSQSRRFNWYPNRGTSPHQPLMKDIIDGFVAPLCFGRWDNRPEFTFLGPGKVISFSELESRPGKSGKEDKGCLVFEFDCSGDAIGGSEIHNFDSVFEDEDITTKEGRLRYASHKIRERDPAIVRRKKAKFMAQHGRIYCEVCGFDFQQVYGSRGADFIECHHNQPLSESLGSQETSLEDLTLLCSNCHRMVHKQRPWISVLDLKKIVSNTK